MTIKEVEKKLNTSRANIRFYEKEGLLDPKRGDNEYRNYSDEDIKRLEQILLFRKCNISIENIRLIFNGSINLEDVFKEQISVIENEVKQLEGAKIICKKLAQEKASIDKIDTVKYINMVNNEEDKGHKFYDITNDYICASEKLYQSIIENKDFKGGEKMKKNIRIGVYVASFVLLILLFVLFDLLFYKSIDLESAICLAGVMTVADLIGTKKYIEKKNGKKFTKKENINHFVTIISIMVIMFICYLSFKAIYKVYKNPNSNVLDMSVKKSLIDIAHEKYVNSENGVYAEGHKIIDYEVKDDKIYAYVVTNYGVLDNNCNLINSTEDKLTMIFNKDKNSSGVYNLKEYKENYIPTDLRDEANINYNKELDIQLNSYCNK